MSVGVMPTFIRTAHGNHFELLEPQESSIFLDDIAVALGRISRFGGHIDPKHHFAYSVAQHSVYVSRHVRTLGVPEAALWGLLHDAAEAYYGDIISPIKVHLPFYYELEQKFEEALFRRFSFLPTKEILAAVKEADIALYNAESDYLCRVPDRTTFADRLTEDGRPFYPLKNMDPYFHVWDPHVAASTFVEEFHHIRKSIL